MKILLTGNIFHKYEDSIQRALVSNGHEVTCLFNNIEGPFFPGNQTFKWLKYGLFPHKLGINFFVSREVSAYNEELRQLLEKDSFDLLLVIKGLTIQKEIIQAFRGPSVLWILDSIGRFSELKQTVSHYDQVFSFEASDLRHSEEFGCTIRYLPVAFDPYFYHPLHQEFERDWSFVGASKPNRVDFLGRMIREGMEDLLIVGDYHRTKNAELRRRNPFRVLEHPEINRIYNTSRINLNIHKQQSVESANPRFYEVMGAGGGIQFTEPQPAIAEQFLDGVHLIYYEHLEELREKSAYYLSKPNMLRKIAQNGLEITLKFHTWQERVRTITDLYA